MRIVVLADVHGNSLALDAVTEQVVFAEADEVVFLGDAVANGFDPRGALDRLRALDPHLVMGNTDADILDPPAFYRDRQQFEPETRRVLEISLWCHEQLTDEDRAFIATFQPTIELELPGDRRLVGFHGSPKSPTDVITAETSETTLVDLLGHGDVFTGGHTHVPLLRAVGPRRFVNPGSVGLPFVQYGTAGHVPLLPVAHYAVIEASQYALDISFHAVPLDLDGLRDQALHSGMPHAGWWASQWPGA